MGGGGQNGLESNSLPGASLSLTERAALVRDGLLNYGGNLVSAVTTILLVPIMLRTLGAPAYGLWIAVLSLAAVLAAFDLGLGSSLTRVVARGLDRDSQSADARFVRAAESLYVWFGVAGALLLFSLGVRAVEGRALARPELAVHTVLLCGAIALVADQLITFTTSVLGGLRRFDVLNRIAVAVTLSRAAAVLLVLATGGRLKAVATAYASASLLTAWFALRVLRRIEPRYRVHLDWPGTAVLRPYLSFGLSSFFVVATTSVLWQGAPALIGFLQGTAAVPLYYAAQKFPLGITAISSRLSIVFFSASSRDATEPGPSRALHLALMGTRWVVSIALPFCVILGVIAPVLLRAWLGAATVEAVRVMRLTCFAVLADALAATPLQVLWGQGEVAPLVRTFLAMGAVSVAMTLLLMPALGPTAAALGLVVAMTGGAGTLLVVAARRLGTTVGALLASVWAGLIGPALAAGIAAWTVSRAPLPGRWTGVIAASAVGFLVYAITFYFGGARSEEKALISRSWHKVVTAAFRLARAAVRGKPRLRSAGYFGLVVLDRLRDTPKRRAAMSCPYDHQVDPWGYATPRGAAHLRAMTDLLDAERPAARFSRAFEVGCGEGYGTELLASRSESILATDVSPAALERAEKRLEGRDHVRFERWDILSDPPDPGRYDLVVVMGVLECFSRRGEFLTSRRKIVEMMEEGGYLLATTTRQHPLVEASRWSRWLIRGSEAIHRFLLASGELTLHRSLSTPTHLFTLYRKGFAKEADQPPPPRRTPS